MELRFLVPPSATEGYRFYLFDELAAFESVYDSGFVAPDTEGVGRVVVSLAAERSYVVQMTASNAIGESARSNAIRVAAVSSFVLAVDRIHPTRLGPGKHTLTIEGSGFTRKPRIRWENGEGKRPRVRFVRVLDPNTLEVGLKIRVKQLGGSTAWDLRVRMRDGRESFVPQALVVAPL